MFRRCYCTFIGDAGQEAEAGRECTVGGFAGTPWGRRGVSAQRGSSRGRREYGFALVFSQIQLLAYETPWGVR